MGGNNNFKKKKMEGIRKEDGKRRKRERDIEREKRKGRGKENKRKWRRGCG